MSVDWIENWSHYRDYQDLEARYALVGNGATAGTNLEILSAGGPTTMPSGSQSPRNPVPGVLRFKGNLGGAAHASVQIPLTPRDRYIFGCHFLWEGWNANSNFGDDTLFFFRDDANNANNISVQVNNFGDDGEDDRGFFLIEAGPGGADHYNGQSEFQNGDLTQEFFLNQWYYLEFDITISNTVGVIEFRRDGVTMFRATALDTQAGAGALIDEIHISTGSPTGVSTWGDGAIYRVTDISITSPGGGGNETGFPYPAVVDTLHPSADTASADFTPQGGGTNVVEIDDKPQHDFDTTYNESNTAAHKDRFDIAGSVSESTFGRVLAVQVIAMAKDTLDTGTRTTRTVIFENVTEGVGATLTLTQSEWQPIYALFEDNPDTTAAWLMADVEAAEIGYEIVS